MIMSQLCEVHLRLKENEEEEIRMIENIMLRSILMVSNTEVMNNFDLVELMLDNLNKAFCKARVGVPPDHRYNPENGGW